MNQLERDKKLIRRMMKRGTAAVEQVLSEGEPLDPWAGKAMVALLVPSYKAPNPRMQSFTRDMVRYTEQNGIARVIGMPLMRNSVVHWQRNELVAELIKSQRPFSHVLFIDDDIVPQPDSLAKLLAHKVDIVAGLCTFRQDPPLPNARFYDPQTCRYSEMRDWSQDGLIEVDAVGTGMMLISREALQKVADVWFECKWEREFYNVSDEWITKASQARVEAFDEHPNAFWFQFLPTPDYGKREYGEDITFCYKAKKFAGLKVYVDTTINPEHIGEYGYTIADYKSQRRVMQERKAKAEQVTVTA